MSDDFKNQTFKTSIGSKALVQREEQASEIAEKGSQILRSLGADLFQLEVSTGCIWVGSAAFHIYTSPALGFIQTVSQVKTLDDTPEVVAAKSLAEFSAALKAYYGRRTSKLRSGHY